MSKWFLIMAIAVALTMPAFAKDKDKDKGDKSAGGNAEQQVKALTEQGRDAALKGDANFLEQHLANNYVGVSASGAEMTKDEAIQNRKTGKIKYEAIELRDQKIRVYGNTALVDTEAHAKGVDNGKPFEGDYRVTFVWVKEGNGWKQVSFHSTPVQPETAASPKR